MEIYGKIIAALPERSGTTQKGTSWCCQSFVLQTEGQYPRHICFDVFGQDKISQFAIQVGENLTVSFDIDAHQYNDRWFNSIRCFNVMRMQPSTGILPSQAAPQQPMSAQPLYTPPAQSATPQADMASPSADDGLPF